MKSASIRADERGDDLVKLAVFGAFQRLRFASKSLLAEIGKELVSMSDIVTCLGEEARLVPFRLRHEQIVRHFGTRDEGVVRELHTTGYNISGSFWRWAETLRFL